MIGGQGVSIHIGHGPHVYALWIDHIIACRYYTYLHTLVCHHTHHHKLALFLINLLYVLIFQVQILTVEKLQANFSPKPIS